ncbi:MAG: relaxase domain-containing protein [Leptolyngbya sp. SIOISBB]|nr:relaxase domain-containing protein [Leptolyngbya sp. SIOISBB]
MLSTSNLSAAQAETYYTKEDYYSSEEAAHPTKWVGKGAAALGLSGTVSQHEFSSLLSGQAPDGQSLSGKVVNPEKRRAATDFTFSAPKSVSIAALVQGDEWVLAAHHQAVSKALSVLEERYAQTRVSTAVGRQKVTTGNLTAAVFTHSTSREAEPQLHSHCVVMNATQLPDGRWFSFSNESAIAHKKLLGQIYQNELAVALKQQGYQIEPKAHGQFELKGYSPELLQTFSTRRQQILKLIEQWEATGSENNLALREMATLVSRKRKPKELDEGVLQRGWQALIQLKNLELPDLPKAEPQSDRESVSAPALIDSAIQHCGERESVFRQTKLVQFIFKHQLGQAGFDEIEAEIASHPELIRVEEGKFTTQAALNLELNTLRLMQQGQGAVNEIANTAIVHDYLTATSLNPEQQKAVEISATTTDQILAWQGVAGAGKTYALNALKELARTQGHVVRGFAPSAEAAHGLGEALGIETATVAGLLASQSVDEPPQPTLWIVDEAGLLSMQDAHALLRRATLERARVLLVGDTRQLSAVEAGNPFKSLQAGGMTTAYLETHRRQQSQVLRSAVELVAQGQISDGIQLLEREDCVREIREVEERSQQVAQDYLRLSAAEREKTLILAGTNQERLELTQKIRVGLQIEGELGSDRFVLQSLRRKDLTTAQASYASAYAPGDVLVPVQDYRRQGLYRAEKYTVLTVDQNANQLTLETPGGSLLSVDPAQCPRTTAYTTQLIPISVGDKLRWTRNNRQASVRNGQTIMVTEIEPDGRAKVIDAEGKTRAIDLTGKQYLDYAWVSTTYSSQGKTANRVLALLGNTTHREAFYVAISRAKHELTLYAAGREELMRLAQVSRAKENVSDYVPLFEQVKTDEQPQQHPYHIARIDVRALGGSIGKRVAEQLAAVAGRDASEYPAGDAPRARRAELGRGFGDLTAALEQQLEPLSRSVADYREQRELLECTGDLAGAAQAINRSLEQLEQSASGGTRLAATVDRLLAKLGQKIGRPESDLTALKGIEPSPRERYLDLWEQYAEGLPADRLELRVARRALQDGILPKEVTLMLVAGSTTVRQLYETTGKQQAMKFAMHMVKTAVANQAQRRQGTTKRISLEIEPDL